MGKVPFLNQARAWSKRALAISPKNSTWCVETF